MKIFRLIFSLKANFREIFIWNFFFDFQKKKDWNFEKIEFFRQISKKELIWRPNKKFQIQSTTSETTPGHSSSRKPSKEDSSPFDASSATPAPSQLETPQQQKPTTTRHFQVEPVVLSEPSTPAPVAPAPSIETLTSTSPPVTQQLAPSLSEPTFQVIQVILRYYENKKKQDFVCEKSRNWI